MTVISGKQPTSTRAITAIELLKYEARTMLKLSIMEIENAEFEVRLTKNIILQGFFTRIKDAFGDKPTKWALNYAIGRSKWYVLDYDELYSVREYMNRQGGIL